MVDDLDSVRREVAIAAPIELVWELITEPEHLQVWYAFDGATLDPRPGGVIEHFWREHGRYRGVIERLEPPTLLSYRYATVPDADPQTGRQTHVEFALRAVSADNTLVRVTERGFADLDMTEDQRRAYQAVTSQGWSGGLTGLTELARHAVR